MTEYEMCEHGRHIGAVCLECAEDKEMRGTNEALNDELLSEIPWPSHLGPDNNNKYPDNYTCIEGYDLVDNVTYVDPFDMTPESVDEVHSPKHYTVGGYETIDVIEAKLTPEEIIGGLKWQIMKYIMRANYKGHHDQDCEKAAWYANRLIKYLEKQKNAKSVDKKG